MVERLGVTDQSPGQLFFLCHLSAFRVPLGVSCLVLCVLWLGKSSKSEALLSQRSDTKRRVFPRNAEQEVPDERTSCSSYSTLLVQSDALSDCLYQSP